MPKKIKFIIVPIVIIGFGIFLYYQWQAEPELIAPTYPLYESGIDYLSDKCYVGATGKRTYDLQESDDSYDAAKTNKSLCEKKEKEYLKKWCATQDIRTMSFRIYNLCN